MGWIRNIPRSLLAVTLANAGMFLKGKHALQPNHNR